jgi:hypothetical protein
MKNGLQKTRFDKLEVLNVEARELEERIAENVGRLLECGS